MRAHAHVHFPFSAPYVPPKRPPKVFTTQSVRLLRNQRTFQGAVTAVNVAPLSFFFLFFFCRRANNSKTERKAQSGAHLFCVLQQPCCMLGPWVPIQQRSKGNKDARSNREPPWHPFFHHWGRKEQKSNNVKLSIT